MEINIMEIKIIKTNDSSIFKNEEIKRILIESENKTFEILITNETLSINKYSRKKGNEMVIKPIAGNSIILD